MKKFVFTLRAQEVGDLHVDSWVDASSLANIKTHDDYVATTQVLERMGASTGDLVAAYSAVQSIVGRNGDMRRKLNPNMSGPYMVMWEDDADLQPDDLVEFLNALPLEKRREWLQGAKI